MNLKITSLIVLFLMLTMSFASSNAISDPDFLAVENTPMEVIVPLASANTPGFQEGSIYTQSTLSSGGGHACAILDNGQVVCWGEGSSGQLGYGGTATNNTPTLTSSLGSNRTAVSISSGYSHTCAILDDGSVACWGDGAYGQLGTGNTQQQTSPVIVNTFGNGRVPISISSGYRHTCVVLDNGAVSCWGEGSSGQLGNGGTTQQNSPTQTSSLGTGRTAISISSGYKHTCVILDNGDVSCWGEGYYGRLGNGGTSNKLSPTLTSSLGAGRTAVAVSAGFGHTCVILDTGSVSCWGSGFGGRLGNGGTAQQNNPTPTSSLGSSRHAISISTGETHTCVILDNGSSSCWGTGSNGRLGNGGTSDKLTPTLTAGFGTGRNVVGISSGHYDSCGVIDNASVLCWGGYLGNTTPTLIGNLGQNGSIALSERDFDDDDELNIFENPAPQTATCPAGQYGKFVCIDAPVGKYVPTSGAVYPTDASPGHYVNQTGQINQTACSLGTYNPLSQSKNQSACILADSGHYVGQTGSSAQTPCPAGRYNPNYGSGSSSDCTDADPGYVVSQEAQASQEACLEGTFQPLPGQTNCRVANKGHYVDKPGQAQESPCPKGTYNPSSRSTDSTDCLLTEPGHYASDEGQAIQSECNIGTYQPSSGQINCIDSDRGYFVNSKGETMQTPCSPGTYQNQIGQSGCLSASTGHYVDSSIGNAQTNQTPCLQGTFNPEQGSTNSSSCIEAEAGFYVAQIGQESQEICLQGTYQPVRGQPDCRVADKGHYVDTMGQIEQTACPKGTYNPATRSTDSSDCMLTEPGYFSESQGQPNQTPCPMGTYNPEQGSTSENACLDARPGHYSPTQAQAAQIECPLGYFQDDYRAENCKSADPGHYVDDTALRIQKACPSGTYQGLPGKSFCNNASVGYYVSSDDKTQQIAAEPGYYVSSEGRSSQSSCPRGTFSNNNGAIEC
ncbi:hypothetical protein OAV29_03990, partial [Candidatus Poseidoniaceae archaeon]|nr:hypothetical protein [Candidatus Poseidoniaceae archaeon]